MGAYTAHTFNHSTLGTITFASYVEPNETTVSITVPGNSDWDFLDFREGKWQIYKSLPFTKAWYSPSAEGAEVSRGTYSLDLDSIPTPEKQSVPDDVLEEIIAEFKKSAPYKHARKEIRKKLREAEGKIASLQSQIISLIKDVEYQRRYTDVNISGL